jgi:hypothetical protein
MFRLDLVVAFLAVCSAVWMIFDGSKALITGNYTTPAAGEYAGKLGPWADLLGFAGISPHATLTKSFFVIYGLIWLIAAVCFFFKPDSVRILMLIFAIGILWYAPIGTISGVLQLIILLIVYKTS